MVVASLSVHHSYARSARLGHARASILLRPGLPRSSRPQISAPPAAPLSRSVSENSPVPRLGPWVSAGLWPFRPRPSPQRALSPSTLAGAAAAPPNLQQIVAQAD